VSISQTKEAIQRTDVELQELGQKIRIIREELNNYVQAQEEWIEANKIKAELNAAKMKLKIALESSSYYNDRLTELGDLNFTKRDLRDIMSAHLIELKVTDQTDAVETMPGLEKPIMLSARLGKEQPATLPMQFNGKVTVSAKTIDDELVYGKA